jgi:heme exporter protein A
VIEADNIAAFRGDRLIFRDISFTLAPGGALLLRGENGAGKSSLLRTIAGLTPLAGGRLLWQGRDALEDQPTHAARLCFVGHLDGVKSGLTAAENLEFAAQCSGRSISEALASVNLAGFAALPARLLSAGQKRRLALARLTLSTAPLWLLDEPTNGLDAASTARLAGRFAAHRAGGGMIIATTHTPLDLPGAETLTL